MNTEISIAIVSATVALISVIISVFGQLRTTKLEHQLLKQREAETRDEKAKALIAKYRDPLLSSAFDLQSRFFSIVQLDFLRIYYNKSDQDKEYATNNTLYVVAEFLGWIEVLRREVQFLDLGEIELNRRLGEILSSIQQEFLTDGIDLTFRLFKGEQRAIGELVLSRSENKGLECIGFAEFSARINDPKFANWFSKLRTDINTLANAKDSNHEHRLIMLQHSLIDLLDFLDPQKIRIPEKHRLKI